MKFKYLIVMALATVLTIDAQACVTGPWHSTHKTQHFTNEVLISGATTAVTKNVYVGVGMGVLAGAVREHYKMTHGANCEWASIVYDAAGIAVGAGAVQHWYIAPQEKGVEIGYKRSF